MFVKESLRLFLSNIQNPQFEGQTKTKLGNSEVRTITDSLFSSHFDKFLLENPTVAKKIVDKGLNGSKSKTGCKKSP